MKWSTVIFGKTFYHNITLVIFLLRSFIAHHNLKVWRIFYEWWLKWFLKLFQINFAATIFQSANIVLLIVYIERLWRMNILAIAFIGLLVFIYQLSIQIRCVWWRWWWKFANFYSFSLRISRRNLILVRINNLSVWSWLIIVRRVRRCAILVSFQWVLSLELINNIFIY